MIHSYLEHAYGLVYAAERESWAIATAIHQNGSLAVSKSTSQLELHNACCATVAEELEQHRHVTQGPRQLDCLRGR